MYLYPLVRSAVGRSLPRLQAGSSGRALSPKLLRSAEYRGLEPARSAIRPTGCSGRRVQHLRDAIVKRFAVPAVYGVTDGDRLS
eukprot:1776191-Pyramimonas_sp.AAC.1